MQDLFTNTFPLDGKIKLSSAGVYINEKKKRFSLGCFSKIGVPQGQKNLQVKQYCFFQVDKKLVSTSRNGEFI